MISYVFGREERDTGDFFLGGRRVPAVVASLSFVAAEISALTIVGLPATAYSENWAYVQFFLALAAARLFVAFVFIPVFYRYRCTSIYEYLGQRFGPATQYAGAVFFFVTRLIASGVRLYAACLGVSLILGWTLPQALAMFSAVSILFIAFGGIKAVVWAGAYQTLGFLVAGLALLAYLYCQIQGGPGEAWRVAEEAGRLSCFRLTLKWNDATTFWLISINAFLIGLASFGADQENVQRLLTVKSRRASQQTLVSTLVTVVPLNCLYLAIGTLLFVYYRQHPQAVPPPESKQVLSYFIAHSLPVGLKGLMLTAIILASVDSPLSSLCASFVTDIYRPLLRRQAGEAHYLFVSRCAVVGFGCLLAAIAWACQPIERVLWFAYEIFSLTGGSLLGIFLLGMLTRRRANRGNVVAMLASTLLTTTLLILSYLERVTLAWSWLIVVGTGTTFTLAYALGTARSKGPEDS